MEINVLTGGMLKNGKIQIDGKNFYMQTALPKDDELKENYIGNNIKTIEFNNLQNGTQKLLTGIVRSGDYSYDSKSSEAIGNNINNYSRQDNKIILTGTYVNGEGLETEIRKEIELEMDWYGSTKAQIINTYQNYRNLDNVINNENGTVDFCFTISTAETNKKLFISKNHVETVIPKLNNYLPSEVVVNNTNIDYSYDELTSILTIERTATVTETGELSSTVSRNNSYEISVKYPIEAYYDLGEESVELLFQVEGYYEGYNNPHTEFSNPYKSNIAKTVVRAVYNKSVPYSEEIIEDHISISIGEPISKPYNNYVISKRKPMRIYNGISSEESDDTYVVRWYYFRGNIDSEDKIILKETVNGADQVADHFLDVNEQYISMEELTTNKGIYFNELDSLISDNGMLKVYDEETGNLLLTVDGSNINRYTSGNPFIYEIPIKHIRIEVTGMNKDCTLYVYNIKELDDDYITNNYTIEEFLDLKQIKSSLVAYKGEVQVGNVSKNALYEIPTSVARIDLSQSILSTQVTEKNERITINAEYDSMMNEIGWKNGVFLVKLPNEIVEAKVSSVTINNSQIKVKSYEYIENEQGRFIKVYTSNAEPKGYIMTIVCDLSPDPRISTVNKEIELYAVNEEDTDYYYKAEDIYDVNGNLNTNEIVSIQTARISLVSPNSLLTNQIASEFDDKGTVVVSPRIVDLKPIYVDDEEKQTVKIGVQMKNNYSNPISEISILGKIPFEGNTYVISGISLDSEYTTTMKPFELVAGEGMLSGIEVPEELHNKVTVYYSENENPDKDIEKTENGWKLAEDITDWTKIKTYIIDFGNTVIENGKEYTFYYTIEIPFGVELNKTAYSHHGIYFSLDTPEGKYKTQTEPNKIGIRISEKYSLLLTKYQKNKELLVPGATYKVSRLDGEDGIIEESRTAVTNDSGLLKMNNLYAEKIYVIEEIQSPAEYELNEDIIKIIGHIDNETRELTIEKLEGTTRGDIEVIRDEDDYEAKVNVEDEIKARLHIIKHEKDTSVGIKGAKFVLTSEDNPDNGKTIATDSNGEVILNGLKIGKEYDLKEVKADGYYLINPIKFKVINVGGNFEVQIIEGTVKAHTITINNDIPTINLEIENECIPTYNLIINKIEKGSVTDNNSSGNPIPGAKFRLYKDDKEIGTYVTNNEGRIEINGLFQYEDEKGINQTYVLKEIYAPEGYTKAADLVFFAKNELGEIGFEEILEDNHEPRLYSIDDTNITVQIEDAPSFKLTKKDKETGELLPNSKFAIYKIEEETIPARNSKGEIIGTKEIIDGETFYVVTTDENGEISEDLPGGLYKAVEVAASDDKYDITNMVIYFEVEQKIEKNEVLKTVHRITLIDTAGNNVMYVTDTQKLNDGGAIIAIDGRYNSSTVNNRIFCIDGDERIVNPDGVFIKINENCEVEWYLEADVSNFKVLADNSIVLMGTFLTQLKYNDNVINSMGDRDIFVMKVDQYGNVVWAKTINSVSPLSIYDYSISNSGSCVMAGYGDNPSNPVYVDEVSVNPASSGSWSAYFFVGFDENGNLKELEPYYINYNRFKMFATSDGGYCSVTEIDNNKTHVITKYDEERNIEWTKNVYFSDRDLSCINYMEEYSDNEMVFVCETTSSQLQIDDVTLYNTRPRSYDTFIFKLDKDGDLKYAKIFEGSGHEEPNGTMLTRSEELLITLKLDTLPASFDDIEVTPGGRDYGLVCIEKNGDVKYAVDVVPQGYSTYDRFEVWDEGNIIGTLFKGDYNSFSSETGELVEKKQIDTNTYYYKESENGELIIGSNFAIGKARMEQGISGIKTFEKSITNSFDYTDINGSYNSIGGSNSFHNGIIKYIGNTLDNGFYIDFEKNDKDIIINGESITLNNSIKRIEFDSVGEIKEELNINRKRLEIGEGEYVEYDDSRILKYDNQNRLEWYKEYENTPIYYCSIDSDNNILVIIENGVEKAFLLNKNGEKILSFRSEYTFVYGEHLACGDYLFKVIESGYSQRATLYRFNSKGELVNSYSTNEWYDLSSGKIGLNIEHYYGSRYSDVVYNRILCESVDGCFYACVANTGTLEIGDYVINSGSTSESIIVKYNKDEEVLWAYNTGYQNIIAMTETINGELIAICYNENNDSGNTSYDVYLVKIVPILSEIESDTAIEVENTRKSYNITTSVESIDGIKGGSISGEGLKVYEKVLYGETSEKQIIMIPDENYEIISIKVNEVIYEFTPEDDGNFIMPQFENMTEDKDIKVKYAEKSNIITINKTDSETGEKLKGVEFKLDQLEERETPIVENIFGELTDNGQEYTTAILDPEVSNYLGSLTDNGTYYFVDNEGSLIPTNSKTYQVANEGSAGVQSSTANSYIPIDLTDLTGRYAVVINAECSSESNYDIGYAEISIYPYAPSYSNSSGKIFRISGIIPAKDYVSNALDGGMLYYLHLGYRKDGSGDNESDLIRINSIKLYNYSEEVGSYSFLENNGRFVSTNQGKNNTTCDSYIPIDLSAYEGKYNLTVNAEISSEDWCDYGFVTITDNTSRPYYYNSTGRIVFISGQQEAEDYETVLEGGKLYYLHMGYYKNDSRSSGDDKFTINSISLSLNDSDLYHTTAETNSDGQAITQIPFGKYAITEIKAPEGYMLNEIPTVIEFKNDGVHEFNLENDKICNVIVHHYIKELDGTLTTTELAEDDIVQGLQGEKYNTSPNLDIERYELEKDENSEFILPDNNTGAFTYEDQEVIYYYVPKKIPLIVHHYVEGTNTPVLLSNGELAQDVEKLGNEGEVYETEALTEEELNEKYKLAEVPEDSTGTYEYEEKIVTYYYKAKSFNITTEVKPIEKTDELGQTISIKGGTISGENKEVYEIVEYDDNSTKEIKAIPDNGYHVEKITVNNEAIDFDINSDGSVTLNKFTSVRNDINVEVQFRGVQGTVRVNHYIEGTEERITDLDGNTVEQEVKTGDIGSGYATKARDDLEAKYELVSMPDITSGQYSEEETTLNYYYRLKEYSYTVEYYYNNVKDNTLTETGEAHYGDRIENYENKPKEGYEFEEVVGTPLTIPSTEGYEIKVYYLPIRNLTVQHIDKNTGEVLETEEKHGKQGYTVTTSAIDIDNYTLVESPVAEEYTYTEEDQIVKYYYAKVSSGVLEKHLDLITGRPVADDVTYDGYKGKHYETSSKEITGYTITTNKELYESIVKENPEFLSDAGYESLVDFFEYTGLIGTDEYVPEDAEGEMEEGLITVRYYYTPIMKLIVKYKDILTGEEILEAVEGEQVDSTVNETGSLNDSYASVSKTFEGYLTVSNKTYYKWYFTNHPEELEETGAGTVDEYLEQENIDPKAPYVPKNNEGIYEVTINDDETYSNEILVTYYYAPEREVIVRYYDKNTGEEITTETIKVGPDGDEYDVSDAEKEIEGYTLVEEPENPEGIYQENNTPRSFYYAKNTQVIVKYVDKDTGESIDEAENYEIDGYEGKQYETEQKTFGSYEYEEVVGETEGAMPRDPIQVIYYYSRTSTPVNNTVTNDVTNNAVTNDISNNTVTNEVVNNTITNDINNNTVTNEIVNNTITNDINNNSVTNDVVNNTITNNTVNNTTNTTNTIKVTNITTDTSKTTNTTNSIINRIVNPKTGDIVPVVAYSTILIVLIANIMLARYKRIELERVTRVSRMSKIIQEDRTKGPRREVEKQGKAKRSK